MFDFDKVGVKSADEEKIVFFASDNDNWFSDFIKEIPEETYSFIGDVNNKEELISSLNFK